MIAAVILESVVPPSGVFFWVYPSLNHAVFNVFGIWSECILQCVYVCYVHNLVFALQTWNPILPDAEISLFWAAPLDTALWLSGGSPPYKIPPFLFCSHESVTTQVTHNKQLQLESLQAWPKGPCKHCLLDLAKSMQTFSFIAVMLLQGENQTTLTQQRRLTQAVDLRQDHDVTSMTGVFVHRNYSQTFLREGAQQHYLYADVFSETTALQWYRYGGKR